MHDIVSIGMENIVMVLQEIEPVKKKSKKLCEHEGCDKYSTYNFIGESKRRYCAGHKQPNMVNVVSKKCEHENCNKQPAFNNPGETNRRFCDGHKQPDMVNVVHKRCEHEGCNKIPKFNNPDETNGKFCNGHKEPEMFDVKSKRCEHEGCNKRPNFNNPDETVGKFCDGHKQPNMVNVNSKKCEHEGCNKRPSYNNPNETTRRFCAEHKQPEMVDVVNKKCEHEGCNKIPYFNNPDETNGKFCNGHKQPNMVNVISKTCKHEWCNTYVSNKKYEGFCMRCYIYKYPLKLVSRNYKTKEFAVVEFIKSNFPNYTWIADKSVQDGCSRRRPDLLLDFGDFILIIEVDENQHVDYDKSCENRRTMEISRDLGHHRNIVFIRFNPDDYMIGDEKITSCWGANKTGIFAVKKSKTKEWDERLNALKKQVQACLDEKWSNKMIDTIYLFYDKK
jgi:hypothetical protein